MLYCAIYFKFFYRKLWYVRSIILHEESLDEPVSYIYLGEWINPTVEIEWQHCLTLPRQLVLKGEKLYQFPVEELKARRKDETVIPNIPLGEKRIFELFDTNTYELDLAFKETTSFERAFREDCRLAWKEGIFTLTLGESDYGRDERSVKIESISNLHI